MQGSSRIRRCLHRAPPSRPDLAANYNSRHRRISGRAGVAAPERVQAQRHSMPLRLGETGAAKFFLNMGTCQAPTSQSSLRFGRCTPWLLARISHHGWKGGASAPPFPGPRDLFQLREPHSPSADGLCGPRSSIHRGAAPAAGLKPRPSNHRHQRGEKSRLPSWSAVAKHPRSLSSNSSPDPRRFFACPSSRLTPSKVRH